MCIRDRCYLFLGLFNILFAWLGMLFFCIPLFIAIFGGGKAYCNRYCGRGQLLGLLGEKLKLSRKVPPLMILVGSVFVAGPAGLLAKLTPDSLDATFWIIVVFAYYILHSLGKQTYMILAAQCHPWHYERQPSLFCIRLST